MGKEIRKQEKRRKPSAVFLIFQKRQNLITEAGIPAERVKKLYEGRPNILDLITNGDISLIINSPIGKESMHDDSYLRKAAII
mgnify:CR=1 FL=1